MKQVVLISRQWKDAAIAVEIQVTDDGITVSAPLEDFVSRLAAEVGSPALLFSAATLAERMSAAADVVVQKLKRETKRVM